MASYFPEFEAKKQELNCGINVMPILNYMANRLGYDNMVEVVESLGLPIGFLTSKANWVSYEYYCRLLTKLVEATKDPRAPFKATFNIQAHSVFQELLLATYATILSDSPRQGYKFAFSKSIYRRYTKIGDFQIISSSRTQIDVRLTLKHGYKQHEYNRQAIIGYMSATPISWGLQPAQVTSREEDNGSEVFTIRWKEPRKMWKAVMLILFVSVLGCQLFLFGKFFDLKDLIITFLVFISISLMIRASQFLRTKQQDEIFNYNRNSSLLEAMDNIESNYKEILEIKNQLEMRNKYLLLVTEISQEATRATSFSYLLSRLAHHVTKQLHFSKSAYFQYSSSKNSYFCLFEADKEKLIHNYHKDFALKGTLLSDEDFDYIHSFNLSPVKKLVKSESIPQDFKKWIVEGKGKSIHILPIIITDEYRGFYCFLAGSKYVLVKSLMESLFYTIANQLEIVYERISSKAIIENILSGLPACVLIFKADDYRIKYANRIFLDSVEKLSGKTVTERKLEESTLFSLLPFDNEAQRAIKTACEQRGLEEKENNLETTLNNRIIECSLFSIPKYKEEERLSGIILIDVTETKSFEQRILTNEKLLGLGRVASGIAHEINNPLYAVLANAEEISDNSEDDEDNKNYAEEIIEHVLNISNIIRDLSSYSKTLRNEELVDISLHDLIDDSLKIIKYSADFSPYDIQKSFSSIPPIHVAKGEIEQVFINLFRNAFYAMDKGGTLFISTGIEEKFILVTVRDTGCGIDIEKLPYIFDLFFTTKKQGEGTGFGLHIVKKIMTKYRGDIKVESTRGQGTTFLLYFRKPE